jgi:hypothetical protein
MKNLTCSHCGYKFTDEEAFCDDGRVSKIECPKSTCGKTFYVTCVHLITWELCGEGGEEL